ncbi:hypothetical protein ABVN80_04290 [Acinetobacter baumannii]
MLIVDHVLWRCIILTMIRHAPIISLSILIQGIRINMVITHVAQDDLPFGGIGASGMGKYHGPEGFFGLSHERSVMSNPKLYSLKYILPPFNKPIHRFISKTLLR